MKIEMNQKKYRIRKVLTVKLVVLCIVTPADIAEHKKKQ